MPSAQVRFERAIAIMDTLPGSGPIMSKLEEDERLVLYKYQMQATIGDITTPKPGFLSYWLGSGEDRAEWEAWNSAKGTSKEDACEKFVEAFIKLLEKPSRQEGATYMAEINKEG